MVDTVNVPPVNMRRSPNGTPADPLFTARIPAPIIQAIRIEAVRRNTKVGIVIAEAFSQNLNSRAREQAA